MSLPPFEQAPWQQGSGPALVHRDRRWDYVELDARAAMRAERLRRQGLEAGQVVMVADAPGPDLIVMQHALARLHAALLPVSPRMSAAGQQALITMAGVEWRWRGAGTETAGLCATGQRPAPPPLASPLALIVATSGSGAAPRAVLLTQRSVLASCGLVNARLELGPGDRWLCCLPRHHVGGLSIGYRCALAGAALVQHDGFDARAVCADLEKEQITHLSLVPPMLARLLDVRSAPPAPLRVLLVGGQALHRALAERAIRAGWPLRVTYGMTETFSQIATSDPLESPPEPGVIGPPLPEIEVDCADGEGAPRPLAVKGPVVMAGYANPGRRPGLGLSGGWLETSDRGTWTARGELRILGRVDDLLVIGGYQVSPLAVESRLLDAPGVSAAVVFGIDQPVWGYSLAAAYTGASREDVLERWCREHLSSHERPRLLRRFKRLPLLPSGKYDRRRIRGWVD